LHRLSTGGRRHKSHYVNGSEASAQSSVSHRRPGLTVPMPVMVSAIAPIVASPPLLTGATNSRLGEAVSRNWTWTRTRWHASGFDSIGSNHKLRHTRGSSPDVPRDQGSVGWSADCRSSPGRRSADLSGPSMPLARSPRRRCPLASCRVAHGGDVRATASRSLLQNRSCQHRGRRIIRASVTDRASAARKSLGRRPARYVQASARID
jgi:hypothetical protein